MSEHSTVPVAVSGGLTFESVSAGLAHTCGVTTDGSDPTDSPTATPYRAPFTIATLGEVEVKAVSSRQGKADSLVVAKTYRILEQVKPVVMTPSSGIFTHEVNVMMTCETRGREYPSARIARGVGLIRKDMAA